uniref:Reverse transcriptase domain-containing protein n=1 Tax=Loa loa TaxID=7209 RepID=A0A1I7VQ92_LOALO
MEQIEQTWKLEAIGIRDLMTDYQDEKAFEAFQKSLTTDKEGRCVMSWPWKNQEIAPAKGYGLAWGRLRTTIRRLKKSPELLECYDEYIKTLLEERIIERMKNQNETWRVSYLPHQAVITPQKSTTKLRVVFDASAKTNEGPSLNECLYRGPAMMPSLVGILLRARQGRYLVIVDVEKAFLQVSLKQEDRDVTRFLWLEDKTKEVTQENLATYPIHASSLRRAEVAKNLYVDNVVLTAENELESNRKAQEAKELFKKAKMYLGEFNANYDIEMDSEQEITKKTATKLLGIGWNNIKDEFTWRWKISEEGLQTKRQILQFYAAIYDPLGLCPIILPWKLLVQDLWKKSVS